MRRGTQVGIPGLPFAGKEWRIRQLPQERCPVPTRIASYANSSENKEDFP
jgi:hypothetical protein